MEAEEFDTVSECVRGLSARRSKDPVNKYSRITTKFDEDVKNSSFRSAEMIFDSKDSRSICAIWMIRHKLIECDALLLDTFLYILQDLHGEDLKEMA
ncbi:putative phosphoenolpyruvate carboxylase [Helianthus annuus]|nr:putative phosphoenolpyruvate carboxylase [Helianthus annuus]KAJ0618413.1 putative phosphoenolpyruvate carboxylase [Helianthus annuus]